MILTTLLQSVTLNLNKPVSSLMVIQPIRRKWGKLSGNIMN
jgi:hypothetical protein